MPVPVPRHRHRVHREHPVPGRDQRGREQAPVGLDPDHHLARFFRVPGGQIMEPGDPGGPVGQLPASQPAALLILDMHVMTGLGPVHPGENQPVTPPADRLTGVEPGGLLAAR